MTRFLWTVLGGILALNVVVVVGAAISIVLERHRSKREIRDLEALWRLEPRRLIRSVGRRTAFPVDHRSRGRRLAGSAVVVVLLCAGTAVASPQARRMVASVLGAVADGLRPGSSEQHTSAAGSDQAPAVPRWGTSHTSEVAPGEGSKDPPSPTAGPGDDSTPPGPAPGTGPASPTTLTAVPGPSTEIDLDWADVANETGYRVERSPDGATGWIPVVTTGQDVTTYSDTPLSAGTLYYYRVFATNAGADSPPSDVTSATTLIDPASPTIVTAVAVSSTEIVLVWVDVGTETGYRVERSPDGANGWSILANTGQDVTTFSDTGLLPGTTYYYRVFATNAGGDSPASGVVWATTGTDRAIPPVTDEPTWRPAGIRHPLH